MKNIKSIVSGKGLFEGRATRGDWWLTTLGIMLLVGLCGGVLGAVVGAVEVNRVYNVVAELLGESNDHRSFDGIGGLVVLGVLGLLGCFFMAVSVTVRRLHDIGMSGWWYPFSLLCGMIPYIGIIFNLVFFFIVGFWEGDSSDNVYGPNPKESKNLDKNTYSEKARLKELDALKQQGFINESEYEAHKNRILLESENEAQGEIWDDSDSGSDNIKAQLMELNNLKQQGSINEKEYDEQKKLILFEI